MERHDPTPIVKDLKEDLPDEVKHGSARAVRLGCNCDKCLARRKKMKRRGWKY